MKLALLKSNPYHTPGVAGLHRPGIFPNPGSLLVRKRKRRNPFGVLKGNMPLFLGSSVKGLALSSMGSAGAFVLQTKLLKDVPLWGQALVCVASGAVLPKLGYMGNACGGALWYGLFDAYFHKVAVDSTSAFFSSIR